MSEPRAMRRVAFSLVFGLALGCVAPTGESSPPRIERADEPEPESRVDEFGPWAASVSVDHPLVGGAWSVAEGRALTREELERRAAAARFVLLGETHDHPDHHRLQGELITALLQTAPGPAVAYEMLDPAQQAQIDEFVAGQSGDVEGFAELVAWADSGWPAWSLYRPVFVPVIAAGLPIFAAQFPRAQTRRFMSEGVAMLPPDLVARYQLDRPLAPELLEPQLDEMFTSHCEMVPREQLAPMVEIQRVRDAVMAEALRRGAERSGRSVLVAGTGHTRITGVPRYLMLAGEDRAAILSVGFVAVDPELLDARDYGDDFDIIVWTPDIERSDPCAAMVSSGATPAGG